jgi:hypothetical protein
VPVLIVPVEHVVLSFPLGPGYATYAEHVLVVLSVDFVEHAKAPLGGKFPSSWGVSVEQVLGSAVVEVEHPNGPFPPSPPTD